MSNTWIRGYGSQDDITVVCDGWGILHGEKAMSKFGNGDYEVNHSSMRWLGHITRRIGDRPVYRRCQGHWIAS